MQGGVRLSEVLSALDRGRHVKNGSGRPKQQPRIVTFDGNIGEITIEPIPAHKIEIDFAVLDAGCVRLLCTLYLRAPPYSGPDFEKFYREREVLDFFRTGKTTGLYGVVAAAVENGLYRTSRNVRSFELKQLFFPYKSIKATFQDRRVDPDSYSSSFIA